MPHAGDCVADMGDEVRVAAHRPVGPHHGIICQDRSSCTPWSRPLHRTSAQGVGRISLRTTPSRLSDCRIRCLCAALPAALSSLLDERRSSKGQRVQLCKQQAGDRDRDGHGRLHHGPLACRTRAVGGGAGTGSRKSVGRFAVRITRTKCNPALVEAFMLAFRLEMRDASFGTRHCLMCLGPVEDPERQQERLVSRNDDHNL